MSARRPNILFVFADQMRGMDMRCAGNPQVITPNMDRMAAEGVMAARHYAMCPICSPNRGTMLTGTYPTTHRLMFNDTPIRFDLPSLGTMAKAQGYRTGYIGKWHLDGGDREGFIPPGPRRLGFDDFWAVRNCGHTYDACIFHRDTPEVIRIEGYEPEVQTNLAFEFLDGHRGRTEPFCLAVSWGPPHNPYEVVPEEYRRLYDENAITFRPNCREIPRQELDPAWSHRPTTRDYYAQITSLDDMLGRLLRKLEEIGAADDTIVVFTSDHGDMMWSQGLLYKCVPYEESVYIPLLVRYPRGLPAGRRCDTLISSVDLLPTLAAMAGWPIPGSVEGADLSAALLGRPGAPRPESIFMAFYSRYQFRPELPVAPWRGVRTERYTFSMTTERTPWLVFDNERDPYQLENLAGSAAFRPTLERLQRMTDAHLERWGDPCLAGPALARHFGIEAPYPL